MSVTPKDKDRVNHHVAIPKRLISLAAEQLPEGVTLLVVAPQDLQPEFIRLPGQNAGDRCPVTGLSRTGIRELLEEAGDKIKTRYLRKKGAANGITLIARQSLIDYIESLPTRGAQEDDNEDES
jgi:hypothetical protein